MRHKRSPAFLLDIMDGLSFPFAAPSRTPSRTPVSTEAWLSQLLEPTKLGKPQSRGRVYLLRRLSTPLSNSDCRWGKPGAKAGEYMPPRLPAHGCQWQKQQPNSRPKAPSKLISDPQLHPMVNSEASRVNCLANELSCTCPQNKTTKNQKANLSLLPFSSEVQ